MKIDICFVPLQMKIVDVETKLPLPLKDADGAFSRGEFWFRGPNIMPGYLNNPEVSFAVESY